MLWSEYLVGCGRYSKQERALSGSRGSSRSFRVRAGAVRIAAEPENVRQPHVLLEIHGGGEGGELDPCAGITALTTKQEQVSPPMPAQPFPALLPSLPTAATVHSTVLAAVCPSWAGHPSTPPRSCLRRSFTGCRLGTGGCSCPAEAPGAFSRSRHPDLGVPQGPQPQALPGATARAAPSQLEILFLTLSEPNMLKLEICSFSGAARLAGP